MGQGLSDREREILREVVEIYLTTGEPVPSAAVARSSATGLSSPSIRNVMAELEAKGFLVQPHKSAGRVPTDVGFRVYVDSLLENAALPRREQRKLRALLAPSGPLEEVLHQVSRALAQVTAEVGMALAPAPEQAVLRSIHFVRVSNRRVLGVVVTQGGLVESRLLAAEHDYPQAELDRISNYCTDTFAGLSLLQIHGRLVALMAEERLRWDTLIAGVVELARQAVESEFTSGGGVFLQGTERLLRRTEPAQLDTVRQLFAALSDKALLLGLLNEYLTGEGPRVVLGSELSLAASGEFGLIVSAFSLASGERGLVGVLGHKRMDYPRIIPIVSFMGSYLADVGGALGGIQ